MDYTHHYASPLGGITLASNGKALTGLWFDGQKYFGYTLAQAHEERSLPIFEQTAQWLDIYFGGGVPDFTPKLKLKATGFRKAVWDILLTIPYGQTTTYGKIAQALEKQRGLERMSAQAVGGAVGHNPISLIVPCHRVVGTNGSLTGYAGGLERKAKLLAMEKAKT
jgi:methylated-DNA-[protein]-cysteine S-methyltransferase